MTSSPFCRAAGVEQADRPALEEVAEGFRARKGVTRLVVLFVLLQKVRRYGDLRGPPRLERFAMPKFGIIAILIILAIVVFMSDDIRSDWLGMTRTGSFYSGAGW